MTFPDFFWRLFEIGVIVLVIACVRKPQLRTNVMAAITGATDYAIGLVTTPLGRELARIAAKESELEDARLHCSNLRGTLNHERNVRDQRARELTEADATWNMAIDQKLGDAAVEEAVLQANLAERRLAIQQGVVSDVEAAVSKAYVTVHDVRSQLQTLQLNCTEEEAKAKAQSVIADATGVLETIKHLVTSDSEEKTDEASIDEALEQAKARLEDAQGTAGEGKLAATRPNDLAATRARLERERNAKTGDAPAAAPQS